MMFPPGFDRFDPATSGWTILGGKACADIPVSLAGTHYDPWQIAGETSDPPDGTNDETGQGDYANFTDPLAIEPGHAWPFMCLSATQQSTSQSFPSTISSGGYYPACQNKEGINHYREFVRLAPRMFGSCGRLLWIPIRGVLKSTNARDCIDIIIHHDLVTSVDGAGNNTTALTAGKYTGFRWITGALGGNEVAFALDIFGHAMGPYKQVWSSRLVVAAQTNPESTAPAIDSSRGPALINLSSTGPDMDNTGSRLALLYAARGTTATSYNTLGSAGGAAQDGSEVYMKVGSALALLSPGV